MTYSSDGRVMVDKNKSRAISKSYIRKGKTSDLRVWGSSPYGCATSFKCKHLEAKTNKHFSLEISSSLLKGSCFSRIHNLPHVGGRKSGRNSGHFRTAFFIQNIQIFSDLGAKKAPESLTLPTIHRHFKASTLGGA